ncbi:thiosulfate dehydrogenase [quinone] large subunit [Stackebrandtia albiflava]|uniref:Thiosulfate dehydrogenase [quinone] large subunit n=1 Tax=Stackebrandtia albiflava TaxID=406432 RepID=A0A562VCV6_9ACTN|nr:DoxX family membrane protein [Stackebrandtia albiflava]TWJ15678.1 thiosulfate dehydrogenase [quinone] large subunit [Stackebrandtia albiflava]
MTGTASPTRIPDHAPAAYPAQAPPALGTAARYTLAIARIAVGWVFLWAFLDKTFGLGLPTPAGSGWLDGGSPTSGYLAGQAAKPGGLAQLFAGLSGQTWVDWLFMIGMGGVGAALVLGVGMRLAAVGAVCVMVPLWLSSWPLAANPFMDQHLVYLLAAVALAATDAGDTAGLGRPWSRTRLVRALPVLR